MVNCVWCVGVLHVRSSLQPHYLPFCDIYIYLYLPASHINYLAFLSVCMEGNVEKLCWRKQQNVHLLLHTFLEPSGGFLFPGNLVLTQRTIV